MLRGENIRRVSRLKRIPVNLMNTSMSRKAVSG